MTGRILTVLGATSGLAVTALLIWTDAISDFLFALPTFAVVGVIIGWPAVILFVVCMCTSAGRADRDMERLLAERRRAAQAGARSIQSGGGFRVR